MAATTPSHRRRIVLCSTLAVLVHTSATATETVRDGAPIRPEFAAALYARVVELREPDGCRITRFDTARFRITMGIAVPGGTAHFFDLATQPGLIPVGRTAGDWAIAVPADLERDCPTTVAAIERILRDTAAPAAAADGAGPPLSSRAHYQLLAATFVALVLGTAWVLAHALAARTAPAGAVAALLLVCAIGLGLRLSLSPRTFLHEYYHIAETVPAYLSGEVVPGYGKTGPAIFRLVGRAFERSNDVRIIFVTNAVLSSLAVPAAALLVLAVLGSWPQAVTAALLIAVLPQHLRFSAAEDMFVQAITFGLWSLALLAWWARTRRGAELALAVLAAALATQTRPEMIFFPAVAATFLLCVQPRGWRRLVAWPALLAGVALALLLVPHGFEVLRTMQEGRSPAPRLPSLRRWVDTLVLFDRDTTPVAYPLLIAVGAVWTAMRRPGWLVWIAAVYVGFTLFGLSVFDNPPFHRRAQNLPMSYLVLLAAGVVPVWRAAWQRRGRSADGLGVALLALAAVAIVAGWRGFVGELEDQQLEWAFLERHVARLPAQGTLLTAVETGGHNLDAFPEFLLTDGGRRYALVDVRRAAADAVPWPEPAGDLLFYQGMFCYFAFNDEPAPDPMTPACRAVHERYTAEPLVVEDLHTEGYSSLRYARGPYRIGFYRLR